MTTNLWVEQVCYVFLHHFLHLTLTNVPFTLLTFFVSISVITVVELHGEVSYQVKLYLLTLESLINVVSGIIVVLRSKNTFPSYTHFYLVLFSL